MDNGCPSEKIFRIIFFANATIAATPAAPALSPKTSLLKRDGPRKRRHRKTRQEIRTLHQKHRMKGIRTRTNTGMATPLTIPTNVNSDVCAPVAPAGPVTKCSAGVLACEWLGVSPGHFLRRDAAGTRSRDGCATLCQWPWRLRRTGAMIS